MLWWAMTNVVFVNSSILDKVCKHSICQSVTDTISQKFGHTFSFKVFFFIFMTIYIVDSHWRDHNYELTIII